MSERRYPYPRDEGQTHYDGCWVMHRHHNCAVEEVYRLEEGAELYAERINELTTERDALRSRLDECNDAVAAAAVRESNLRAELEQLRNDAVVVREGHWDEVIAERDQARAEVDDLIADRDGLRVIVCELVEALEDERDCSRACHHYEPWTTEVTNLIARARAALGEP